MDEMMMFQNRENAGKQLAEKLIAFKDDRHTIVIGLPRGGVPVAYEVSKALHLPLDIVCPRKIGAPMNKEFAIGAITETGEGIFDVHTIDRLHISKDYITHEVELEKAQARRRIELYRKGKIPRDLMQRTVILIDDGLATGSTMKAAIKSVKAEGAYKVVVAVPVSPPETIREIENFADQVICLCASYYFQSVGQFFEDFSPTEDEEVIAIMERSNY